MKLFIFLLLSGCAPASVIRIDSGGAPLKLCNSHILVVIDPEIPDTQAVIIRDAASYWNETVGHTIFLGPDTIIGSDDRSAVLIRTAETSKHSVAGVTTEYYAAKGCIISAGVRIRPNILNGDHDIFESVIRHELGHVLGLGHSDIFTDLMAPSVETSNGQPIDASDRECAAARSLYPK